MIRLQIDSIHENTHFRIKDQEKARIFHTLYTTGSGTRKALADTLKLRPITVSKVVRELIDDKLINEELTENKTGKGRPEINLNCNHVRLSAITIGVVSREITGSLVNLGGERIASYPVHMPEYSGNEALLLTINKIITSLQNQNPESSELVGISLSLPGTVNTKHGEWVSSSRWPNLKHLLLDSLIVARGLPVFLYRFLDPELEFLLSRNSTYRKGNGLLFHWGYGIGSAASTGGRVLTSSPGRFGEIGHWTIIPGSEKLCRCGAYGCLETEAALWAMLPEIKKIYPDTPEDESEFSVFIRENKIGKPGVFENALNYTSVSLANLCKIFYPDKIFLKGPFFYDETLLESFKDKFFQYLPEYKQSKGLFEVVSGTEGTLYGSVFHLFRDALRPLMKTRGNV